VAELGRPLQPFRGAGLGLKLYGRVDYSLDSTAFWVNHEGRVVVRSAMFPEAWCTVVSTAVCQCRSMELIDGFTRAGAERKVES
jgi:hypothetical protein